MNPCTAEGVLLLASALCMLPEFCDQIFQRTLYTRSRPLSLFSPCKNNALELVTKQALKVCVHAGCPLCRQLSQRGPGAIVTDAPAAAACDHT